MTDKSKSCIIEAFSRSMPLFSTEQDRQYAIFGLRIASDFGASIAIPVVLFVWIGQWLEDKYGHAPWFTVSAFALAALLSGWLVYRRIKEYAAEYQKLNEAAAAAKAKKPITKL